MTETRLHLDGVGSPIVTQITRRSESGMTVEQTLPFLKLHTLVHDDDAVPSKIESVSVVVYDGLPRLVLDLAYETAAVEGAAVALAEPAAAMDVAPHRTHPGVARPVLREQTVPFDADEDERDPTALFQTHSPSQVEPSHHPGAQLTLEEQLLRSGTLKYKFEQAWIRVEPFAQTALALSRRFIRWSRNIGLPIALNWLARARDGVVWLSGKLAARLARKTA